MGLFDQIINAIDDPNQQANLDQLTNIFNTTQQLGNSYGVDPSTVQSVLSIVGNYDADRDGDVDIADAMQLASRHLN